MPNEPEVMGLLALMRLHIARAAARFSTDGDIVLLEDQDRAAWDHDAIASAATLLESAMRIGPTGPYQVQAAIAALHATAPSFADTDWMQIVGLYGALHEMTRSPVVAMNRAVAMSYAMGVDAGLRALDALEDELRTYAPFHTTRSELLRRAGRQDEALAGAERALALVANPAERRLLEQRIEALSRTP
jgi:RNA polymerase sigma-70 factor (ECF subfamily)